MTREEQVKASRAFLSKTMTDDERQEVSEFSGVEIPEGATFADSIRIKLLDMDKGTGAYKAELQQIDALMKELRLDTFKQVINEIRQRRTDSQEIQKICSEVEKLLQTEEPAEKPLTPEELKEAIAEYKARKRQCQQI